MGFLGHILFCTVFLILFQGGQAAEVQQGDGGEGVLGEQEAGRLGPDGLPEEADHHQAGYNKREPESILPYVVGVVALLPVVFIIIFKMTSFGLSTPEIKSKPVLENRRMDPKYGDVIKITLQDDAWALYVDKGEIVHLVLIGGAKRKAMLKNGLLCEVAGNSKSNYYLENRHDGRHQIRETRAIKRSLDLLLEKQKKYEIKGIFEQYSQLIVEQLRYDSIDMECSGAKPGDMIEMPNPELPYSHWGVYVGNGYIVHLVTGDNTGSSGSSSGSSGLSSGSSSGSLFGSGYVWKDRLTEYVPDKNYKVNNKYDKRYQPRDVMDIIKDANEKAWKEHEFNLLTMNCEHFATKLRYSVAVCDQLQKAPIPVVGVVGIYSFLNSSRRN